MADRDVEEALDERLEEIEDSIGDEPTDAAAEMESAAAPRRFSTRRRLVAWGMLGVFALALAYPFFVSPRVRYVFSSVPQIRARDVARAPRTTIPPEALAAAQDIVRKEVRRSGFPGAALAVGERGRVLVETGMGRTRWGRLAPPVDADETLYDLASLTKVVGTTAAVMALVDDGKMSLDDRVSKYLPHFTGGGREKVTIRHLLTHTAGLPAAVPVADEGNAGDRLFDLVAHVELISEPGDDVLYSDVGFVILGLAAANAAHRPLGAYVRDRVWRPLGMLKTRFEPGLGCSVCAPTLTLEDGTPFAGRTNDPFSRELGGITGNAGLFSTGHDVARFAAMMANGGALDGVRIFRESTVRAFMTVQPGAGLRALGWEAFCREGTQPDHKPCKTPPYAIGHTGYTGTSIWIDPRRGIWVVLLSNRTYLPKAPNHIRKVRRQLFNVVTGNAPIPVGAETDTSAERR
ncbi:MAG TPA: serine hydrolase domain-containing protein [Longimicrobium sp.]